MPDIVDYPAVLRRLTGEGFVSLYHNSGAFGFPAAVATFSRGWIGEPDPTIRPAALPLTRRVGQPVVERLVDPLLRWCDSRGVTSVWAMPKSHWAYELTFGNAAWLPARLADMGVDGATLAGRTDGSALAFAADERAALGAFVGHLLADLVGSDFALAFPGRRTVCTVHSHRQLWWTTADPAAAAVLDELVPADEPVPARAR